MFLIFFLVFFGDAIDGAGVAGVLGVAGFFWVCFLGVTAIVAGAAGDSVVVVVTAAAAAAAGGSVVAAAAAAAGGSDVVVAAAVGVVGKLGVTNIRRISIRKGEEQIQTNTNILTLNQPHIL